MTSAPAEPLAVPGAFLSRTDLARARPDLVRANSDDFAPRPPFYRGENEVRIAALGRLPLDELVRMNARGEL